MCILASKYLQTFGLKINKYEQSNLQPLGVVGRDSVTQLQVGENFKFTLQGLRYEDLMEYS